MKAIKIHEKLEKIISNIIYVDLNICNSKNDMITWKNVINILEEARINCENDKYFNLDQALKILTDNNLQGKCAYHEIQNINNEIEDFYYKYISKKYKNSSVLNIMIHKDIFEECINYIFNKEKFEDEENLIEIEGYNAKKLIEEIGYNTTRAYNLMVLLRESPREALEDINYWC